MGADTGRGYLRGLVRQPSRADARRNYAALLAAAGEVFGRDGPDGSLDEIARRAGVGNATLYRHFPTRRDLLVAACVEEVETLCQLGEELGGGDDRPGRALSAWLRGYLEHVSRNRGLGAAMMTGTAEDSTVIAACQRAVERAGAALLEPAKRAGEVRADLTLADLLLLANAVASAAEAGDPTEPGRVDRLLDLVLYGIVRGQD